MTFLTGASALVYEVAWQRYLANFLGSQAQATAIILAVFLGGLCAGYLFFGRVSRKRSARETVHLCGIAEAGIGAWVLLFPSMYRFVWYHGTLVDPEAAWSHVWEIGISALLIGVPTMLMGGTLPLLTQGLSRDLDDAAPFHARVYAVNTAGAFCGCLLAGFVLLPLWGLTGTMYRLGPVNLAAGGVLALLARRIAPELRVKDEHGSQGATAHEKISVLRATAAAFLAGYYSLTLQTIFMRVVGLSMGTSEYTFCMVVAVFIAMLAFGAWRLSRPGARARSMWLNQSAVFFGSIAVYITVSYWPYAAHVVRVLFTSVPPNFYLYHAAAFLVLAAVLAVPVGAMGGTMPLLFGATQQEAAGLGSVVGRLYAWNTVGCALGALFGGYFLLTLGNMDWIFRQCLVLMGVSLALVIPWRRAITVGQAALCTVLCGTIVWAWMLPQWNERYLGNGIFRVQVPKPNTFKGPKAWYDDYFSGARFLAYRDGTSTTVSVTEYDASDQAKGLNNGAEYVRNLKVNGKSDGETSFWDMRTMRLAAHLPALLSKKPIERAGVIGFGLGVSAGTLTQYPEIKDVHVVEISPAVKEVSPLFDFANYGASKSPKLRWSIGDAYRVLGATPEKFQVIVSEPSNPWVIGVERLFSREFYELMKTKLEPGGIYSQWIHDYTLSEPTWGLMVNTFGRSFPYVRMFRVPRDTIMLGSMEPIDDDSLAELERRYDELPFVREALSQVLIPDKASILGLELWVRPEQFPKSELQTLEYPKLAHRAGYDFFLGTDMEIQTIFEGSSRRLWMRAYEADALVLPYIRRHGMTSELMTSYAGSACDTKSAHFYVNWKTEMKPCRDSLVALGVMGAVPAENGIKPGEIDLLRRLRSSASSADVDAWRGYGDVASFEDLQTLLDLFGSFDSEFLKLSTDRLLLAVQPCLVKDSPEAMRCRSQMVEVLAVTLHPHEAESVFQSIEKDDQRGTIGSDRRRELRGLLEASRVAVAGHSSL